MLLNKKRLWVTAQTGGIHFQRVHNDNKTWATHRSVATLVTTLSLIHPCTQLSPISTVIRFSTIDSPLHRVLFTTEEFSFGKLVLLLPLRNSPPVPTPCEGMNINAWYENQKNLQ
ncbi:hypothetical protein RRG08_025871 [Elysia crispata]|uniref:Uncharacterized protein n=1 Tax=Elysia crispata TaxID=231223 RepID=A0AAE1DKJ5_9GAST|nr:hypothetical protein RRG08_025871 [Elysia crispata]